MSQRIGDRPTRFLSVLKRENISLNAALNRAHQSTLFHLGIWMKNPLFNRQLQVILVRRKKIHALAQTLTRFCAVEKFSDRVEEPKTTTECLRRTAEPKAKRSSSGVSKKRQRPSGVHPEITPDELDGLRSQLN